jgi:hypothetical protein
MSVIPLHLQRRFEQRWAARFGTLVMPAVPQNVGLKRPNAQPCAARGKGKEKPSGVEAAAATWSCDWFS